MTRSKLGSLSIATVLCLVVLAPVLTFASAPGAAATTSDTADTYVVEQGGECIQLEPHGDGSQTVEAFYDYRTPYTDPSAWDYSSYGTEDIQENQVSKVFVHEGSEGTSLVFLHDKREDGEPQPYGSTITMQLSDLPEGEWAVRDDTYRNGSQDDDWQTGGSSAAIDWKWREDRSDGGAYRGLDNMDAEDAITIDPGFNEEAAHWGDWNWAGDADNRTARWVARSGDGSETELDMSEPITIRRGICGDDETAPEASATASPTTVTAGEEVSVDASDSTDNLGIERYEWDFGDGSGAATGATATHVYEEPGSYEVTLTVTDAGNNTDTATVPVTVEPAETEAPDEPPTATLDAPGSVTAGETAAFDASGSSDDGDIVEYRWEVDGSSVDDEGPTLERTFSEPGDHTVAVTVVDDADQTNTSSAAVTVEAASAAPPTAEASADPATAAPGDPIEFDATASTDDGEITAYEWAFGDGNASDGASPTHAYASTGEYVATLTVTDDAGNTNTTTVPVTVEAEEPDEAPTANLTGPESAGVGETVTFDAGESTDDTGIVEYQWSVDGSSVDATDDTLEQSFVMPGDHIVTVTAVDGADQTNSSSATVTVKALDDGSDGDGSNESDGSGSDGTDGTDGDQEDSNGSDGSDGSDDSNTGDDSNSPDDTGDSDDSSDDSPSSESPDNGSPDSGSPDSGSPNTGGGSGGAVPPADESASANVSQTDGGRLVVTVENAVAGEAVSADVPGNENATGLRAVELVPATDADELTVTLVPGGVRAPNGTDDGLYEIRTENGSNARNVTYRLAVDRAHLGESGEPQILAGNEANVTAVNHTVVENGSTTVVEATTAGANRVVVAAVAPDVSATTIRTNGTATAGEPATVEATLANDGHLAANRTVNLSVDGTVVDSRNVTVPAGSAVNVSFETTFDAAGDTRVSVAGTEGTVSVASADGTDTEGATDDQSTDTETTDAAPSSSPNTELALAGFGILVIGAAGLIRIL